VSLTFITGDLSLKNYETESYFAEDFTEYSLSSLVVWQNILVLLMMKLTIYVKKSLNKIFENNT